jgi:hypothetical protein
MSNSPGSASPMRTSARRRSTRGATGPRTFSAPSPVMTPKSVAAERPANAHSSAGAAYASSGCSCGLLGLGDCLNMSLANLHSKRSAR